MLIIIKENGIILQSLVSVCHLLVPLSLKRSTTLELFLERPNDDAKLTITNNIYILEISISTVVC